MYAPENEAFANTSPISMHKIKFTLIRCAHKMQICMYSTRFKLKTFNNKGFLNIEGGRQLMDTFLKFTANPNATKTLTMLITKDKIYTGQAAKILNMKKTLFLTKKLHNSFIIFFVRT